MQDEESLIRDCKIAILNRNILVAIRKLSSSGMLFHDVCIFIAETLDVSLAPTNVLWEWDLRIADDEQRYIEIRFFRVLEARSVLLNRMQAASEGVNVDAGTATDISPENGRDGDGNGSELLNAV